MNRVVQKLHDVHNRKAVLGDAFELLFQEANNNPGPFLTMLDAILADQWEHVSKFSIHAPNSVGYTPLSLAIMQRCEVWVIKALIQRGADLTRPSSGMTPFMFMCEHGDRYLELVYGMTYTQLNRPNPHGYCVVEAAFLTGTTNIQLAIMEIGGDPNFFGSNEDGNTLIMRCAVKGYRDAVQILLLNGANLHSTNKYGETILEVCVRAQRFEMIEYLSPFMQPQST